MQLRSRITVAAAALAVIVPLVMIQGSQSASASTPIRCGTQFSVWPCLQAVSDSTKIIGVNYWAHNPQSVPEPGPSLNGNWFHLELVGPGGLSPELIRRDQPCSGSQYTGLHLDSANKWKWWVGLLLCQPLARLVRLKLAHASHACG